MKDFNKIIQAAENKREVLKTLANKYKDSQVPVTSEMWNALVDLTTPVEIEIPEQTVKTVSLDINTTLLRNSPYYPIPLVHFGSAHICQVVGLAFRLPLTLAMNQMNSEPNFDITVHNMQITGIPKTGIDRWEIGVPVATSVYPHNSFTTLNLVASGEIFATSGGGNVKVVVSYIAKPV